MVRFVSINVKDASKQLICDRSIASLPPLDGARVRQMIAEVLGSKPDRQRRTPMLMCLVSAERMA
ncbi:MAG: hypothetical protein KDK08_05535 [Rhizobiaceae bacterium]|nr:hypothetical protein [Rhizobiaceae bacterium]MCC0000930.1 hypothetical protein [Methylobacteriaceae bacterium]